MSYEGHEQHICEKGHRFNAPCQYGEEENICHCGAKSAWHNPVDDTNCDSFGVIRPEDFGSLMISGEKTETCNLGHTHITREAIYRLPKDGELVRYYRDLNDRMVPVRNHSRHCKNWDNCHCPVQTARVM